MRVALGHAVDFIVVLAVALNHIERHILRVAQLAMSTRDGEELSFVMAVAGLHVVPGHMVDVIVGLAIARNRIEDREHDRCGDRPSRKPDASWSVHR